MAKIYHCQTFPMGTKIIGSTPFEVKNSKIVCTDELGALIEDSEAFKRGDIVIFKGNLDDDGMDAVRQAQVEELKFLFDGGLVEQLKRLPDDAKLLIREYCKEVVAENLGGNVTDGSDDITIEDETTTKGDPDNSIGENNTSSKESQVQQFTKEELEGKSAKILLDLATNQYKISGLTTKTKKPELVESIQAYYSLLPKV